MRVLGAVGRLLIGSGVLLLGFVVYTLWGTGIREARSQRGLGDEFEARLEQVDAPATVSTEPPEPVSTAPDAGPDAPAVPAPSTLLPDHGAAVARIEIPKIGIVRTVVEGVDVEQLKRGPGHYEESPLPGQAGNAVIAGHRTTYGQPFHNIDHLEVGDEVIVETVQGRFVYTVDDTFIVGARQVEILEDKGDNRLTLFACHPKWHASHRYVVTAQLTGTPAPEIEGQDEYQREAAEARSVEDPFEAPSSLELREPASGQWTRVAALGVGLLAIVAVVSVAGRFLRGRQAADERGRRPVWVALRTVPYALAAPVLVVTLYFFYESLVELLPGQF